MDRTVLSSFTVNFVQCARDTQNSYWVPLFNNDVVTYCSVPWQFEIRAASTNGQGMTVQNGFSYFAARFSAGVPSNFTGFGFWDYADISSSEWNSIANNLPCYG